MKTRIARYIEQLSWIPGLLVSTSTPKGKLYADYEY